MVLIVLVFIVKVIKNKIVGLFVIVVCIDV